MQDAPLVMQVRAPLAGAEAAEVLDSARAAGVLQLEVNGAEHLFLDGELEEAAGGRELGLGLDVVVEPLHGVAAAAARLVGTVTGPEAAKDLLLLLDGFLAGRLGLDLDFLEHSDCVLHKLRCEDKRKQSYRCRATNTWQSDSIESATFKSSLAFVIRPSLMNACDRLKKALRLFSSSFKAPSQFETASSHRSSFRFTACKQN